MKTKAKLIVCSLIFTVGGILNVFFSTALHNILTGQMKTPALTGFFECVGSIVTTRQHLMLFLCLSGFMLILAVVFFLTNMRPYQSHLNSVTPDIQTPAAVGQYQHGSAKWLTDKEKDKAALSLIRTMSRYGSFCGAGMMDWSLWRTKHSGGTSRRNRLGFVRLIKLGFVILGAYRLVSMRNAVYHAVMESHDR